jgi:hypothetical protein
VPTAYFHCIVYNVYYFSAFVMAIMRSVFKVFDVDYFFVCDGCLRLLCVFFISVLS